MSSAVQRRFPEKLDVLREVFAEAAAGGSATSPLSTTLQLTRPSSESSRAELVEEPLPKSIGRYTILNQLGRGAFGTVYLAEDRQLERQVAIKVPHRSRLSHAGDIEQYLAEARVLASLDHPHIVPVFDFGQLEDGRCYVVSKYIKGGDLRARLETERLSHAQAAELVATLAEALHHAHRQRITHRDIKPANVLMDEAGRPHLADFGLALADHLEDASELVGTPAYMSPEQASGSSRVDGRSDIFSLGVVLYELLTAQRPFSGSSWQEVNHRLKKFAARPPRQIDDAIPEELQRICLRALSKEADQRYTTAKDLADDLRAYLDRAVQVTLDQAALPQAAGSTLTARANVGPLGCGLTVTLAGLLLMVGVYTLVSIRSQESTQLASGWKPIDEAFKSPPQQRPPQDPPLQVFHLENLPRNLRHTPAQPDREWLSDKTLVELVRVAEARKASVAAPVSVDPISVDRSAVPLTQLLKLYRQEPDSGRRAAVRWLLESLGERQLVADADRQLSRGAASRTGNWFVNGQGQTMVVVRGPAEIVIERGALRGDLSLGLPPSPEEVRLAARRQRLRIERSFAIAATEVTVAEFRRFQPDFAYDTSVAPDPECPAAGVIWNEAAAYCNWLSRNEDIPQDQWCYVTDDADSALALAPDCLQRTGYRLPTELEWQMACWSASSPVASFAHPLTLLTSSPSLRIATDQILISDYGWHRATSGGHLSPVAKLRPNRLGLFDMYGNVAEWCIDLAVAPSPDGDQVDAADRRLTADALSGVAGPRVLRGGSYATAAAALRPPPREAAPTSERSNRLGFRVVRTLAE